MGFVRFLGSFVFILASIVLGTVLVAYGAVTDTISIFRLGLPGWAFIAAGMAIYALTILKILYNFEQRIEAKLGVRLVGHGQAKRLTPRQKSELSRRLMKIERDHHHPFSIVRDTSSRHAARLAQDFEQAFADAGWNIGQGGATGCDVCPPSGIGLLVRDPASAPPFVREVADAMAAADIQFDIVRQFPALGDPGLYITDPE